MANEKISAMTDIVAGHSSDILPLVRSGDTTNYSISLAEITAFINAGTGTVTSVALSGGTTGLTVSGSPITGAGTLTLGGLVFGTMAVENSNSVAITGGTITGMPTPSAATDVAN